MAFIPGCERDVFISYARVNDYDGWVTRFQRILQDKLTEYLGSREKPEFWFDTRDVSAGDSIRDEIQRVLERTAAMVSVITPSYLSSPYCVRDELEYFWRTPGRQPRVIIQTVKMPLHRDQQVPFPESKYVEFLARTESGEIEELDPSDPRFARVLNKVANQLGTRLDEMRRRLQTVFIAEPSQGLLLAAAKELRADLHGHGYHVPDDQIAAFTTDDAIRSLMERADVSVHFVAGSEDVLASRQLALARTLGKPMVVASLVPLETTMLPKEADLPLLIAAADGAPRLAGDWRQRLVDHIRRRLVVPDATDDGRASSALVYVWCQSKTDVGEATDLIDTLHERNCEVLKPDFRLTDPPRRRQDHQSKLQRADGVVLYGEIARTPGLTVDAARQVVAECPAAASSDPARFAIGGDLAGLDAFLDALATRARASR